MTDCLVYYHRDIRKCSGREAIMLVERLRDYWQYDPEGTPRSAIASYLQRNPPLEAMNADDLVPDGISEDDLEARFENADKPG